MDSAMETYLLLACLFFFWQWREQINIYIDENYIRPVELVIQDAITEDEINDHHRDYEINSDERKSIIGERLMQDINVEKK